MSEHQEHSTINLDRIYCILQAYATQIIEDCDSCNEEYLEKFLRAYSLYRALILGEDCDLDISGIETTLNNYITTMECRTCGNC